MSDRVSVSHITDDMVERATIAVANVADEFRESGEASAYGYAVAALSAALAGCTVVDLPEPDAMDHRGNPIWNLTSAGNDVTVCVDEGQPFVSALSPCDPADLAEAYALALLAGVRAARRLAGSVSPKGDTK